MPSYDVIATIIYAVIWAILSVVYINVFGMAPGARAWGTGAVIFILLTLAIWVAEKRAKYRS